MDGILKARGLGRSSENLLDIDQEPAPSNASNNLPKETTTAIDNVSQVTIEEPTPVDSIDVEKQEAAPSVPQVSSEETPAESSNDISLPHIENLVITDDQDETVKVTEQDTVEDGVQVIEIETVTVTTDSDGNEVSSSLAVETVTNNMPLSLVDKTDNNENTIITTETTVAWMEKPAQDNSDKIVAADEKVAQLNVNSNTDESNLIDVVTEPDNTSSEISVSTSLATDVPSEESPTSNGHEV